MLVATVKALKHHAGDPDGGMDAIETGAANMVAPPRDHPRVRPERRRGRQRVPGRHERRDRPGQEARARARRLRRRDERGLHARRRGRSGARRSGGRGRRRAVEVRLHLSARRSDRGEDRGDREARLRRRRDHAPAGRAREDQGVRRGRARQAADLHGEDAPLALGTIRLLANAPTGFTVTRARPARLHRRGLDRRAVRRHADDAGPRQDPAAINVDIDEHGGRDERLGS